MAALIVLLTLVLTWQTATGVMRWHHSRPPRVPRSRRRARTPEPRPGLPKGHQPPPGLSPLSPSERFLSQETQRGMHDLETFLFDGEAHKRDGGSSAGRRRPSRADRSS